MEIIHHHLESLPSTNDFAKDKIHTFARDQLTLITAEEQTGGRGRYGRVWVSPKGLNFYGSFVFFIKEEQAEPLSLTHLLAISIVTVLEKWGIHAKIKWPNDVMVEQKKIAGILCETVHLPPHFGVVIGVGLNVNMPQELLKDVGQPATSMLIEKQDEIDLKELTKELKIVFQKDLEVFLREGFAPFMVRFRALILPGIRHL